MNIEEDNLIKMIDLKNISENGIALDPHFSYKILTSQYVDEVVNVFTEAFCRSEPMTHYLKMDEEKYKIFARAVAEKAVEDKLSVVALHKGKVVACALVEDIANPGAIPDFDPKFVYILGLLDELGKNFFLEKTFEPRHIAHLFITAVHENYRHQGLSKQVNFLAMDLAKQNDFDFMYCELTHVYNEKGIIHHLKNPKRLIGSCTYREFVYKGEKPFANLGDGARSYIWAIRDNALLRGKKGNENFSEKL